jgi:hypothetical protein
MNGMPLSGDPGWVSGSTFRLKRRRMQAHDDPALHLRPDGVGVDDRTPVHGADYPGSRGLPFFIDGDLGHLGHAAESVNRVSERHSAKG